MVRQGAVRRLVLRRLLQGAEQPALSFLLLAVAKTDETRLAPRSGIVRILSNEAKHCFQSLQVGFNALRCISMFPGLLIFPFLLQALRQQVMRLHVARFFRHGRPKERFSVSGCLAPKGEIAALDECIGIVRCL